MTLGEKLQRLRRARGWTQEQLAERIGVSRQSLSKWESDAALPDTANVIALADLFGVTTDHLLREDASAKAASQAAAGPEKAAAGAPGHIWRALWAKVTVAGALIGLVALRIGSSFHPCRVGIDGREYTGFAAFLYYFDLWWLLYLLLAALALGLAWWLGPALWRQGRRLLAWLRET